MKKRFYAAYGSNLNFEQMKYRCPTAKLYGVGKIEGYELQFKGSPSSAYATVAPMAGASVPAAVWEIHPRDEQALDRYEGYPSHYFKKNVPVQLDGQEVMAMAYIMNQKMDFGLPSPYYYATVLEGYRDCGLDTDALDRALKESTQRFYSSAVRLSEQQTLLDCNENDEEIYEEPDESDSFCFSDGIKF